jgi:predicted AlkP superfamily pyrophosphatase or phosphodiesterase
MILQDSRLTGSFFTLACILLFFPLQAKRMPKIPRLITIFVVDQCAYHYIPKLRSHFAHGFKTLLDNGIVYENAYYPHAIPKTVPGHHCLSTGALPNGHGAPFNSWFGHDGLTEHYDEDDMAPVFKDDSLIDEGKSSRKTVTDSISDQFVLSQNTNKKCYAFSLSLKAASALATATNLGKPLWFDEMRGGFTSSNTYFKKLPDWVKAFNQEQQFDTMQSFSWELLYPEGAPAYQLPDIKNYDYAEYSYSMITKGTMAIKRDGKKPFKQFLQTPKASKALMAFAKKCLFEHTQDKESTVLMWVLLSNLDFVCRFYGPKSLETIDLLYHIDEQIGDFMQTASRHLGAKNCLFVLTADHGIAPIPELAAKNGLTMAKRVMAKPMIKAINGAVEKKYGIKEAITGFKPTYFKSAQKDPVVLAYIKELLANQPGIRKVWTLQDLESSHYFPGQREFAYKALVYPGRGGDFMCMPQPYCQMTDHPKGTSHQTPYEYDTHVPLVLYQPGRLEKKVVIQKVFITQLAPTLAEIMRISRPASAMDAILPGV